MPDRPKLLLVDDETAITDRLEPFLSRAGFQVKVADDGEVALREIVSFSPDLVVLDVLMPKIDGREVLRQLRQKGDWTPVILLTQVGESSERAMALMEGADDYINKPFDSNELVARIQSVLRRVSPGQPPLTVAERVRCDDLVVDRTKRRAYLNNEEIILSPKAMSLLEYMITRPDELLSRERILDAVWGWDYPIGTRTIDTRVAELRRVLEDEPGNPKYIETVSGQGYRFIGKVEKMT
ncbi:MAG: response regulator transcription factor [Chloroflexota bacterium]|nr:MAG: response regulator transcription factor [Chloroflexota bacterium]